MKHIYIPFKKSTLQIILSAQFRRRFKHLKLSCFGSRYRKRLHSDLEGRIVQDIHVHWRWFPLFEYIRMFDGEKRFLYFKDDPFPLQCFVEYEFWRYKHDGFDTKGFVAYMADKFQLTHDEVIDGCNEVMLNLYNKHKERINVPA